MPVDPTDPDAFEDVYDAYEEEPEDPISPETPEEDAAEQHAELLRQREVPITGRTPTEADPADAAEQARVIEENDDEYR